MLSFYYWSFQNNFDSLQIINAMNFLRNFLASLLALVVFTIGGFLFFTLMISALGQEEAVTVKENSVLHLKLNKPIQEYEFEDPLGELPVAFAPGAIGLVQLKTSIEKAKEDDNIKGILLEVPLLISGGFSSIEELRSTLQDFKDTGKFIIAYSEYYSEAAYYLSTVADVVTMHPEGDLEFNGLSLELTFFKKLFDKLDMEPQIFRVGDFKSAVEPFVRTDMSEENEQQLTALLESVYTNMISRMAEARGIPQDSLRNISDNMLVRSPQEAIEANLLDELYYFDEVNDWIRVKLELETDANINLITYEKYKKSYTTYKSSKNEVAVIVASGEIIPGEGDNTNIGGERFAKSIRKARLDDDVKAIVLRINSPGGSFIASDVMWREIKLASEQKPVIASMSDVAASGGYYMAMACDTIVAMPTTITGSIGIFGMIIDASGFFNDKLGITFDEVKTGEISNLYTFTRPLTEREKQIIQNDIEAGYETFVTKAANGRGMSVEALKEVASGRVWSGEQALENNLVDILGDFELALSLAVEKAGIEEDYKVRYYPKPKSLFEELFGGVESSAKTYYLKEELGPYYNYYQSVKRVMGQQGVMSRMEFDLHVK